MAATRGSTLVAWVAAEDNNKKKKLWVQFSHLHMTQAEILAKTKLAFLME